MMEPPDCYTYQPVLDGVLLKDCIEADVLRGIVVCYRLNEDGNPFVNTETGNLETEEKRGKVEIIHPDDLDEWMAANFACGGVVGAVA